MLSHGTQVYKHRLVLLVRPLASHNGEDLAQTLSEMWDAPHCIPYFFHDNVCVLFCLRTHFRKRDFMGESHLPHGHDLGDSFHQYRGCLEWNHVSKAMFISLRFLAFSEQPLASKWLLELADVQSQIATDNLLGLKQSPGFRKG